MPFKSPHPSYYCWANMIQRCHTETHAYFKNYGGRGIVVCDRWRSDFMRFVDDMGERPNQFTIERIDVNGNYEPGNCRWASKMFRQQRNDMTHEKRELTDEQIDAIPGDYDVSRETAHKIARAIIAAHEALNADAGVMWKQAFEEEQRKFQQETLRTSELSSLMREVVDDMRIRHTPGPWSRSCIECEFVKRIDELLAKSINAPTPPAEQPTKVETTYARQHAAHTIELTALINERGQQGGV